MELHREFLVFFSVCHKPGNCLFLFHLHMRIILALFATIVAGVAIGFAIGFPHGVTPVSAVDTYNGDWQCENVCRSDNGSFVESIGYQYGATCQTACTNFSNIGNPCTVHGIAGTYGYNMSWWIPELSEYGTIMKMPPYTCPGAQ